ncbi:MAG: hypothetical protein KME06_05515 [Kastovskya adunca ATA6-11-RM4]|jgi:membrane protein implicated in regulation of membrane protease activity|nr:hypothetical protein [Kastovskya adunca ATA6-11-RM4]
MVYQAENTGAKIAITAIIWSFATGMLAICIPLVSIMKGGVILPLAVVLGANMSTAVVWRSSQRWVENNSDLKNNVKQLSERIVTLETICSSEELAIQHRLKQLTSSTSKSKIMEVDSQDHS